MLPIFGWPSTSVHLTIQSMADVFDRPTRSRVMSRIRGSDTRPEMTIRRFLHSKGFRFRLHVRDLPGRPDIVLPRFRVVIFVHGCFWHQHPNCKFAVMPKTNRVFWEEKLNGNRLRDRRNEQRLRREGWRVFTIWECNLKPPTLNRLAARIVGSPRNPHVPTIA